MKDLNNFMQLSPHNIHLPFFCGKWQTSRYYLHALCVLFVPSFNPSKKREWIFVQKSVHDREEPSLFRERGKKVDLNSFGQVVISLNLPPPLIVHLLLNMHLHYI